MTISAEIREIEKHVKSLASEKETQVAIVSKAQSMSNDEREISILAIVKNRIIRS